MEAAGVEPASETDPYKETTCLFHSIFLDRVLMNGQGGYGPVRLNLDLLLRTEALSPAHEFNVIQPVWAQTGDAVA